MGYDFSAASQKLNEMKLDIELDDVAVEILWARAMSGYGEYIKSRHMHSSYEFHYIPEGTSTIRLDSGEFIVAPGNFYITSPEEYHEVMYHPDMEHAEYSLNCDFSLKTRNISKQDNIIDVFKKKISCAYEDKYGIIDLFNKALYEAYYEKYGSYNIVKACIEEILILTARTVAEKCFQDNFQSEIRKKGSDYVFEVINSFIEENIERQITPSKIAAYVFLSEKQINRIIKKNTNMTTMEYIGDLKFKKARRALRDTSLSIGQISDMLGFSSEYYFSQFFKNREGRAPSVYRKGVNP